MTRTRSEQSLLVTEGMRDYWRKPGVVERRALQTKVRERRAQLDRLERHGMADSDRFRHIERKLAETLEQLEQL